MVIIVFQVLLLLFVLMRKTLFVMYLIIFPRNGSRQDVSNGWILAREWNG